MLIAMSKLHVRFVMRYISRNMIHVNINPLLEIVLRFEFILMALIHLGERPIG